MAKRTIGILPQIARATCALATGLLLASCAGAAAQLAPGNASAESLTSRRALHGVNHEPNWISPAVSTEAKNTGLLFVADNFNNQIDIFSETKPKRLIGTITNGIASPSGLGVDSSGDLYVANLSANSVAVYLPPYTLAPTITYAGGFYDPVAVAIGADGSLYVSDYSDGLLVEYPPHSTKPSKSISLPGRPDGLALDGRNNLFVAYESYDFFSGVLEFAPGSTSGKDLGIRVGFAGGLSFDSSGNLLVVDESAGAQSINVYSPGSTKPSQTITDGLLNPISIAFNARQRRLYIADAGALDVESISYPGARPIDTFTGFGGPYGVALSPPAPK
jgi:hypothetical protein